MRRLSCFVGLARAWWSRVFSKSPNECSGYVHREKVSDLNRLLPWHEWDGPIVMRKGKLVRLFTDEAGKTYEVIEPGSPADPFTVLHSKEHSFSAMWYYLNGALSAVEEGDCERAESLLIQARGKAINAHSLLFPKEGTG